MERTHPYGQVENATAPSAGGSPDPDGKARLGKRLPFRTSSSHPAILGSRAGSRTPDIHRLQRTERHDCVIVVFPPQIIRIIVSK